MNDVSLYGDSSSALTLTRLLVVQAHLQYYTEPSSEPLPASSTLPGAVLPLGPGTLTHNIGGVPIIVPCTKADLIDEGNDVIGAGASGMGGMVKGKGGEWEERTARGRIGLHRCGGYVDVCFGVSVDDAGVQGDVGEPVRALL